MKKTWVIVCIGVLALVQIAMGDNGSPTAVPAATAAAGARASITAVWPASSMPTHPLKEKGVPNFGRLNDNIWRSGQPTQEGYQRLASEGLKTVVNLRAEFPQDEKMVPQGVQYFYIPIKDEHAPTDEQAKKFLDLASDPANWPLLVHCAGGQGRAGVMSALVRDAKDGWDHSKIMKEVGNYRKKYLGFISVPMASCQQQFIEHYAAAKQIP